MTNVQVEIKELLADYDDHVEVLVASLSAAKTSGIFLFYLIVKIIVTLLKHFHMLIFRMSTR